MSDRASAAVFYYAISSCIVYRFNEQCRYILKIRHSCQCDSMFCWTCPLLTVIFDGQVNCSITIELFALWTYIHSCIWSTIEWFFCPLHMLKKWFPIAITVSILLLLNQQPISWLGNRFYQLVQWFLFFSLFSQVLQSEMAQLSWWGSYEH